MSPSARGPAPCGPSLRPDGRPEPDRPLRVLVCGSRDWKDVDTIRARLSRLAREASPKIPTIVHGHARGADMIAHVIAHTLGLETEFHPTQRDKFGKRAGPIRNNRMLDSGVDLVLAFQRGESRGTQHVIDGAERRGIPVEVIRA